MSVATPLRVAAGLLTRAPGAGGPPADGDLARAVPWLPVVGAGVGLAVGGVYAAGTEVVALPPLVAAVLALGAGVAVTGGLHEDGLADVADAAGGSTPEDRRLILRDPRVGTFGVLALVLSVLVRVAALAAMGGWTAAGALVAAHAAGRGAAAGLLVRFEPLPGQGLGASWARDVGRPRVLAAVAVAALVAAAGLQAWDAPVAAAAALVAVAVLTAAVRSWSRRALGGMNGDVLGAAEQLGEMAVLVTAAAAAAG